MYRRYARVVGGLRIDRARALREVDDDHSTMTEIADTLVREADVPFRSAHSYASELARYGRATGKRPADLADEELSRLYQETIGGPLPIGVGAIRDQMSAEKMVANRKGLGGPQAESVRGMLDRHRDSLAQTRRWLAGKRAALAVASKDLQTAFEGLSQPDR